MNLHLFSHKKTKEMITEYNYLHNRRILDVSASYIRAFNGILSVYCCIGITEGVTGVFGTKRERRGKVFKIVLPERLDSTCVLDVGYTRVLKLQTRMYLFK